VKLLASRAGLAGLAPGLAVNIENGIIRCYNHYMNISRINVIPSNDRIPAPDRGTDEAWGRVIGSSGLSVLAKVVLLPEIHI